MAMTEARLFLATFLVSKTRCQMASQISWKVILQGLYSPVDLEESDAWTVSWFAHFVDAPDFL